MSGLETACDDVDLAGLRETASAESHQEQVALANDLQVQQAMLEFSQAGDGERRRILEEMTNSRAHQKILQLSESDRRDYLETHKESSEVITYHNDVRKLLETLEQWRRANPEMFENLFLERRFAGLGQQEMSFYDNRMLADQLSLDMVLRSDAHEYVLINGEPAYRGQNTNNIEGYIDMNGQSVEVYGSTHVEFVNWEDFSSEQQNLITATRKQVSRDSTGGPEVHTDDKYILQRTVEYRIAISENRDNATGEMDNQFWSPEVLDSLRNSNDEEVQALFQNIEKQWNSSGLESDLATRPELSGETENYVDSFRSINLPGVRYESIDSDGNIIASLGTNSDIRVRIDPKTQTMMPAIFNPACEDHLKFPLDFSSIPLIQALGVGGAERVFPRQSVFSRDIKGGGKTQVLQALEGFCGLRGIPLDKTTSQKIGRAIDRAPGFVELCRLVNKNNPELPVLVSENGTVLDENAAACRQAFWQTVEMLSVA